MATTSAVPRALRRRWWLIVAVVAAATALVVSRVGTAFTPSTATRWLLAAAPPLGFVLWYLRRSLPLNYPPAGEATTVPVRSTLGVANGVSVARGTLYAGVAGFLLVVPPADSAWRWLPAIWYGLGITLDWVDGVVARSVGRPTLLGERLDLAYDTAGFLLAPLVAVVWGALPTWYLLIAAARYLYRGGCWLHERRGGTVRSLPPSRVRRPLAALQMVVITVALVPVTPMSIVHPAATAAMLPSLAVFTRDYLAVTGRLRRAEA